MNYLTLLPEIIIVAVAMLLPVFTLYGKENTKILPYLAAGALGVAMLIISIFIGIIPLDIGVTVPTTMFGGMMVLDTESVRDCRAASRVGCEVPPLTRPTLSPFI